MLNLHTVVTQDVVGWLLWN